MTDGSSEFSKIGAAIRFYFHIDPKTLSDDEFFEAWGQLTFMLQRTGQGNWK